MLFLIGLSIWWKLIHHIHRPTHLIISHQRKRKQLHGVILRCASDLLGCLLLFLLISLLILFNFLHDSQSGIYCWVYTQYGDHLLGDLGGGFDLSCQNLGRDLVRLNKELVFHPWKPVFVNIKKIRQSRTRWLIG